VSRWERFLEEQPRQPEFKGRKLLKEIELLSDDNDSDKEEEQSGELGEDKKLFDHENGEVSQADLEAK
jgi:hypothetical protein